MPKKCLKVQGLFKYVVSFQILESFWFLPPHTLVKDHNFVVNLTSCHQLGHSPAIVTRTAFEVRFLRTKRRTPRHPTAPPGASALVKANVLAGPWGFVSDSEDMERLGGGLHHG